MVHTLVVRCSHRCAWCISSFGIRSCVTGYSEPDVSIQPSGAIFKSRNVQGIPKTLEITATWHPFIPLLPDVSPIFQINSPRKNWQYFSIQISLIFRHFNAFRKFSRLHPFFLQVRATGRQRWVRGISGMILTGHTEIHTRRKTYTSAKLTATNPTWTNLRSKANPAVRGRRRTASILPRALYLKSPPVPHSKHIPSWL